VSSYPIPDMHMTEEEQILAMRFLVTLVGEGEYLFSMEDRYEDILDLLGEHSVSLAEVVDKAHRFIADFFNTRGLPIPTIPTSTPPQKVH